MTAGGLSPVVLAIAKRRHYNVISVITGAGLGLALLSLIPVWTVTPLSIGPLFVVDPFAHLMMAVLLLTALACLTLSRTYFRHYARNREEFFLLFSLAVTGAMTLVCSRHLASLFIGLELLALPVYGMVTYNVHERSALEAGIKYLILGAASSAFMLFGMALLYALSGSLSFGGIAPLFEGTLPPSMLAMVALVMILVAVAFKLSLAPFHLWTPDVYQGAPAPVTTFLATVTKVAIIAVFVRFLIETHVFELPALKPVLSLLAILSILAGNLLALGQRNIKRILGYSSIAHVGYLLAAVVAATPQGLEATIMYLFAYVMTALGSFGVVSIMSSSESSDRDAHGLQDYRGLFWRYPFLALVMANAMLSLTGTPLSVGFIGKFQVAIATVGEGLWGLVAAQIVGSAIGVYYCLRVMITLFLPVPGMSIFVMPHRWRQQTSGLMLLGLSIIMLVVGIWPQPLIHLIQEARVVVLP
ncbi:MAG: NADH-quinone oxidoreductase subunit N [Pseudomonadota bacterium]